MVHKKSAVYIIHYKKNATLFVSCPYELKSAQFKGEEMILKIRLVQDTKCSNVNRKFNFN